MFCISEEKAVMWSILGGSDYRYIGAVLSHEAIGREYNLNQNKTQG